LSACDHEQVISTEINSIRTAKVRQAFRGFVANRIRNTIRNEVNDVKLQYESMNDVKDEM